MTKEVWRLIPSLPEYLASNEGRVMRIPYLEEMPRGGWRQYGGDPHFGVWNKKDGRFQITFRQKVYKVARLVCEAFNGPASILTPYCLHIDENARNNRADNLKWGTQKENLNMPLVKAYHRSRTGINNPRIKGMQCPKS